MVTHNRFCCGGVIYLSGLNHHQQHHHRSDQSLTNMQNDEVDSSLYGDLDLPDAAVQSHEVRPHLLRIYLHD